jgi:hypothetical protein
LFAIWRAAPRYALTHSDAFEDAGDAEKLCD